MNKGSVQVQFASPRRSFCWTDIVSFPLFVNVIKNNVTSSTINIIVCMLKTK